jgi:hypothetical protein
MKEEYRLKETPASFVNNCKFPIKWTGRHKIRNKPERLINSFLPIDDVKKLANQTNPIGLSALVIQLIVLYFH